MLHLLVVMSWHGSPVPRCGHLFDLPCSATWLMPEQPLHCKFAHPQSGSTLRLPSPMPRRRNRRRASPTANDGAAAPRTPPRGGPRPSRGPPPRERSRSSSHSPRTSERPRSRSPTLHISIRIAPAPSLAGYAAPLPGILATALAPLLASTRPRRGLPVRGTPRGRALSSLSTCKNPCRTLRHGCTSPCHALKHVVMTTGIA